MALITSDCINGPNHLGDGPQHEHRGRADRGGDQVRQGVGVEAEEAVRADPVLKGAESEVVRAIWCSGDRVSPPSEVIGAILLECSPCCGVGPHRVLQRRPGQETADGRPDDHGGALAGRRGAIRGASGHRWLGEGAACVVGRGLRGSGRGGVCSGYGRKRLAPALTQHAPRYDMARAWQSPAPRLAYSCSRDSPQGFAAVSQTCERTRVSLQLQ